MAPRILIAPDKFKGTLTAAEAARAMARGWRRVRPRDRVELLPMSDGGDGFGDVLGRLTGARKRSFRTVDAAHRPVRADWWWQPRTRTAILETARVIGLAMLPRGEFHPFELDTFGLGAAFAAARRAGCRECLVGIGGSATNDGGFGLARALGWRFLDGRGDEIIHWTKLLALAVLVPPDRPQISGMKVTVAVDVRNPLLGLRGATAVYGPQKGLRPADLPAAERALGQLARVARKQAKLDAASLPGAGAAGGLGFGLFTFLGARAVPGVEIFARHAKLQQRIRAADLVLTGEGSIDRSTIMGKGVGELARLARASGRPCIGLAGVLADARHLARHFAGVHCLTPEMTRPESARSEPARWLARLAAKVAADWGGP